MAPSAGWSPFLRSITIGVSALSLRSQIILLEPNFPDSVQMLNIQYDNNVVAGNFLFVGNSGVSATNCGVRLTPSQGFFVPANVYGKILTSDVFLLSTVAAAQVNIMALGSGM